MDSRIAKDYAHFKEGYSYEVIATQTSKLENQGAEEFLILGYQEIGKELENVIPALSYKSGRQEKALSKIEAFFEDLFN